MCPSSRLCECMYNDCERKRHMSTYLPLISRCQHCRGEPWDRCAAAFPVGTGGGFVTLRDLSQPDLESCGPPCHGRLPLALNSLGEHAVVFGPCDRVRIQHLARELHISNLDKVLPPFLLGNHGITLLACSGRNLPGKNRGALCWCGCGKLSRTPSVHAS